MIARTLYLVRHCSAAGQHPDAPLTAEGQRQAARLAERLGSMPINQIVASPFRRAQDSIAPLAVRLGLPVFTDERLAERVLCAGELPDWRAALRRSFEDMEQCLEGGESSRAAQARGVAAIADALADPAHTTVLVTHGNLMALLLHHFDSRHGYDTWVALANPDVYRVVVEQQRASVERVTLLL